LAPSIIRKQLAIMTLAALWIIIAGALLLSDNDLNKHPVNLLVSLFICSLPAVLFGGIALWWLKQKPALLS
ncbi:MAG: hypothetical protein ACRD4F_07300, partial [Candidatus Angelobacter sp.]